jgi:outer membrane protein assembly factor BamD
MRKSLILLMILSLAFVSCGKKAVVKKVDDPGVSYVEGVDLMKKKKYDQAITSFAKLRENYPFDPIAVVAQVKQADAYFEKKDYQMAASTYEDFVTTYPDDENAPYAMKRLAESYEKELPTIDRDQAITLKAIEKYTFLKNRYPTSPYAADAQVRLKSLDERLAARELYVGEFYYRTGRYNASIMRLEYFLDRHSEARDRDKALYYLTEDYRELDSPDKARYYFDLLVKDYPKSSYVRQAPRERKARQAPQAQTASPRVVAGGTSLPVAAVTRASFSYDERTKREIPLRPIEPMPVAEAPEDAAIAGQQKEVPQTVAAQTEEKGGSGDRTSPSPGRASATQPDATSSAGEPLKAGDEGASERTQAAAGKDGKKKETTSGDGKKDALGFFSGNGPIEIDGDAGESLEKGRVLIFKGNVIARQIDPDPTQTFYLFCDKLTAYTSEDTKEVERAEAEGNVKLVKHDRTATSKAAFYYKEKAQLILKGDVVMFMGTDKLSADTLTYYIDEDRFYVQGDKEKRAKATITPKKK